jgi:hypothetical protein
MSKHSLPFSNYSHSSLFLPSLSELALPGVTFHFDRALVIISFTCFRWENLFGQVHDFPQGILMIARCNPLGIGRAAWELRYISFGSVIPSCPCFWSMSFFLSSRAVTYNCYGVRGLQQTFHLVCLLLLATHSCSRRTSRPCNAVFSSICLLPEGEGSWHAFPPS